MTQYSFNLIGAFTKYTPDSGDTSKGYARRNADGADLYDLLADPATFTPNSLKLILSQATFGFGGPTVTGVASLYGGVFEAADLVYGSNYPAAFVIVEIIDYKGYDPVTDFINHLCDIFSVPGKVVVTEPPAGSFFPYSASHVLATTYRRATDAEVVVIEEVLAALPLRDRRIIELSDALASTDPLFLELADRFVAEFGLPRAQRLLAQQ